MRKYISIVTLFCVLNLGIAQVESAPATQPTVMVVPFAKEGESMRWIFEHDYSNHLRIAVAKVKEGLAQQGIKTIDFRAVLKQMGNQEAMTGDQQTSLKQKVIELSGADIYVETEAQAILTPSGNSVTVILSAYDAFTGQSLVNKLGHSPKFYTSNFEKLSEKALETCMEDFSFELASTFREINNQGRTVSIDIGITEDAEIDMDSSLEPDADVLLSDIIEAWVEENAQKADYHIQGVTATKIIFDIVRIPPKDPETGKNNTPSKFAARFRNFLSGLGLEVSRDVQGSKIFISISG